MNEVIRLIPWRNIIWSFISILIAYGIWTVIRRFRNTLLGKLESTFGDNVRKKAAVSSAFNTIRLLIIALCILSVLQINGVDVTSILAGLGIAGAIAGLAWQDVFKDFIQGIRIMSDSFFSTGDFIRYNGADYQVVEFTMRTTRLRSLLTNDILTVSNRNITEVTQISGTQYITVGLSYDTGLEEADQVLAAAAEEINRLDDVDECRYLGFKEFQDSSTDYLLSLTTSPKLQYSAKRAALRIIRQYLDAAGLEIPYNQLDIHQK